MEDDALRNAKVDLTRAHTVNAADNGTSFEGRERMDLYHILLVQKDATLAGLEGVVTLVRTVPEPGTAALGLLGVGGCCYAAAKHKNAQGLRLPMLAFRRTPSWG